MAVNNVPRHVAIIMDGNGRWARSRALPKIAGHRAGIRSVREAIEGAREAGVKILTLYTFSTENWNRPRKEIEALFKLLEEYLIKESRELDKNNIRFTVTGDIDGLPRPVREKIKDTMELTRNNTALTLNLALNYGGRQELIKAFRDISSRVSEGEISAGDIDEKMIADHLYTKGLPDPDLLIRTSGEYRVSNFLLWQIAYTELYIVKKFWPDFRKYDFRKALSEYQKRERRFGR